jgi:hypothetical protein
MRTRRRHAHLNERFARSFSTSHAASRTPRSALGYTSAQPPSRPTSPACSPSSASATASKQSCSPIVESGDTELESVRVARTAVRAVPTAPRSSTCLGCLCVRVTVVGDDSGCPTRGGDPRRAAAGAGRPPRTSARLGHDPGRTTWNPHRRHLEAESSSLRARAALARRRRSSPIPPLILGLLRRAGTSDA